MTTFERTKQPLSVFEHAGRTAFLMLIFKSDNPYPKTDKHGVNEPANLAWDRGYQLEADALTAKTRAAKTPARKPFPLKRPLAARPGGTRPPLPRPGGMRPPVRPGNHPRFAGYVGHADRPSSHLVPVEVSRGK